MPQEKRIWNDWPGVVLEKMRSETSLDHMFEDVELLMFDHVMENDFWPFWKNLPHTQTREWKSERLVNTQEQCFVHYHGCMDVYLCHKKVHIYIYIYKINVESTGRYLFEQGKAMSSYCILLFFFKKVCSKKKSNWCLQGSPWWSPWCLVATTPYCTQISKIPGYTTGILYWSAVCI